MENKGVVQSMFGVFGKKASDVKVKAEVKTGGGFFNPDALTAPQKTWRGVIKFMPKLWDFENEAKTETVETVSFSVKNGTSWARYMSPKSTDKYAKCAVSDRIWAMKNSGNASLVDAVGRAYSQSTYALIQIIADVQNPENNGKLMVWNVPRDIIKQIESQMFPSKEDIEMSGAVENNVYDPINGYCMSLKITVNKNENGEFREYGECKFNEKLNKLMILKGETTQLKELPTDEAELAVIQQKMLETIQEATESFRSQEYKGYDEADEAKFLAILDTIEGIQPKAVAPKAVAPKAEAPKAEAQKAVDNSDDLDGESLIDEDDDVLNEIISEE